MTSWQERAISVIADVGMSSGISAAEMIGPSRLRHIVRARQEAMLAVRERLDLSYTAIGQVFARDHTTIIAGCRAATRRRAQGQKEKEQSENEELERNPVDG